MPVRRRSWEADGWCLLEALLPDDVVRAAQAELPALFPTAEEFAADRDPERNRPFRTDSHTVMPGFPFEAAALNDLVLHDSLMDLAEEFLGLSDLRLYQGMLSAKYSMGAESDEQLLHVDYGNHTLVVPRTDVGLPAPGALRLPERRDGRDGGDAHGVTPADGRDPAERTYLSVTDYPQLYEAEVPAVGAAGPSWPTGPTCTTAACA